MAAIYAFSADQPILILINQLPLVDWSDQPIYHKLVGRNNISCSRSRWHHRSRSRRVGMIFRDTVSFHIPRPSLPSQASTTHTTTRIPPHHHAGVCCVPARSPVIATREVARRRGQLIASHNARSIAMWVAISEVSNAQPGPSGCQAGVARATGYAHAHTQRAQRAQQRAHTSAPLCIFLIHWSFWTNQCLRFLQINQLSF